ncbi:hypothetical protein ACHAWF_007449, partial [Thalassiosira exigua]
SSFLVHNRSPPRSIGSGPAASTPRDGAPQAPPDGRRRMQSGGRALSPLDLCATLVAVVASAVKNREVASKGEATGRMGLSGCSHRLLIHV